MLKGLFAFLFIVGTAIAAPSKSAESKSVLDFAKSESSIEFLAVGKPSMLKIRGKAKPEGTTKPLDGSLTLKGDKVEGKASFALNTLETGISLRDRHMKEKYLETAKFPKADFVLTEMTLPEAVKKSEGEAKGVPFKGKLTVHGVVQDVSGVAEVKRKEGRIDFSFDFGTKITGHKIELPSFMGVTVAEDVQINVKVEGPLSKVEGPLT